MRCWIGLWSGAALLLGSCLIGCDYRGKVDNSPKPVDGPLKPGIPMGGPRRPSTEKAPSGKEQSPTKQGEAATKPDEPKKDSAQPKPPGDKKPPSDSPPAEKKPGG
jgi:hypothetical protein